jgi:peptidoglycan/LPS O-acetylase OafA/YrhL
LQSQIGNWQSPIDNSLSTIFAYCTSPSISVHRFRAKHFPALDGLRGIAILLVITHHQLIPLPLKGGFLGVDLFFVLSGFLITTLLLTEFDATENISLKNFYIRRVLRLAPALLLYLLVTLLVTYRLHPEDFLHQLKLVGLALVYLTNWRMAFGWDFTLDPTAIIWSLSIEEQFYLLWPIALFACLSWQMRRSSIAVGLLVVIIAILAHRYRMLADGAELHRLYYGSDTRADAPLMGCLIALLPTLKLERWSKLIIQGATALAVCAFVYLVSTIEYSDHFLYRGGYTLIALLAGVITWNAATDRLGFLQPMLEWSPLRWIGKISYGLYLWHWLLLKTTSFYHWVGDHDAWIRLIVAILVSAVCFYVVEQQFNNLKKKFSYGPTTLKDKSPKSTPSITPAFQRPIIQPTGPEL